MSRGHGSVVSEDLGRVAGSGVGTVWKLEGSEDLNANLVRLPGGGGIGEHVNGEVDVLVIGVFGSGTVEVEGERCEIGPGRFVFVPKGARRSFEARPEGVSYLSVHRRKGPIRIGRGGGEA
ncbi:cupin domain-containing protein [Rubrobacter calidifluminis]|uniref:cupin domain-containing protein n=1 Tax=Rubrobacter calidifluminis TaxID=1392640 RepID=UPI00235ED17B|nr:cupin domain-containing protein [Rubrobacter calidifluminis]